MAKPVFSVLEKLSDYSPSNEIGWIHFFAKLVFAITKEEDLHLLAQAYSLADTFRNMVPSVDISNGAKKSIMIRVVELDKKDEFVSILSKAEIEVEA